MVTSSILVKKAAMLEGLISPETESTRETSNGLQVTEYCQWLE
jgi:hypothetical protein